MGRRSPIHPPMETDMNQTLRTLICTALALSASGWAAAQSAETPRIDQRQANQERRIDQGVASGRLTPRETRRLERQQNRVDRMENRAKADGVVTGAERARLTRAQNRTSRHIYRQKHDAQSR